MDLPTRAEDGHTWTTRLWPAADAQAGLFWIPALGVPAGKYERWAQSLAARGVTVAVHEWRGNDTSSLRPARDSDWGYRELVATDMPASLAVAQSAAPGLPWMLGGHSLGGQLAVMAAALDPEAFAGLLLIATGVPDQRSFRGGQRALIAIFARVVPLITSVFGLFPGDRLNWAGREAATVMRQWAGTVRTGNYDNVGLPGDIEQAMKQLRLPALGLRFTDDWLVPEASLDALFGKLGEGRHVRESFDAARLGDRADHFRWMKTPEPVNATVAAWIRAQFL
ncbi:alpha/beta hydrolase family protein [Arenimonas oryziterrae]|uniref:Serine aminopeptidase S33 domain-containing protein n=1 Tax=Arenimonas oryziterrae DSM 21050 = YC6267 TaxID=1121015 RepID=A0A091ARR2_9GAMM|nr:alpha/beta fold hydrolase [Arenimonas oryziterrae]KFN42878.1 hypothetical protein N789_12170 [Arenimonas oryziterrae DSM 21050 = YC6267]